MLDLLSPKSTRLLKYVSEKARADAYVLAIPWYVEQHEGEGLLHARQRPEGDTPEGILSFFFGDEAPLGAHRACGEHALQVALDSSTVVWGSGGLDEEVEFVGIDGTAVHLYGPPAAARCGGKQRS